MGLVGFEGPMPDVAGDVSRYQQQFQRRYPDKKKPALNPRVMDRAATNAFRNTGVTVPTELALAQAQFETMPQLLDRFENNSGKRYASNKNYESDLRKQIPVVQKRMR